MPGGLPPAENEIAENDEADDLDAEENEGRDPPPLRPPIIPRK